MAKRRIRRKRQAARKLHSDALVALIVDFQVVEEALKCFLEMAFTVIRERTADVLACKLDRTTVEELPLGRLIKEFSKYNDDAALVRDLQALVKHRNHCAHRAFMDCMRPEKGLSVQDRHTEAERLQEISARLRSVQDRLMSHLSRVGTSARDAGLK